MLPFPVLDVPLHCINEAALEYHVPAKLIISVLMSERGKIGKISKNKNGTYDIGPMQINSTWLLLLTKRGISRSDLQYNPCINVKVGAWILGKKIANRDDLLVGIGAYNSATTKLNHDYYQKVRINHTKLSLVFNSNQPAVI